MSLLIVDPRIIEDPIVGSVDFRRGRHLDEWEGLWEEMTEVRRAVPGAAW